MLVVPIMRCLLCREELPVNITPMSIGDLDLRVKRDHVCNPALPHVHGIAVIVGYRRTDEDGGHA